MIRRCDIVTARVILARVILARVLLDGLAAVLFVAALGYWGFGALAHEVIGAAFFALVIAHNLFNRRWYGARPRLDAAGRLATAIIAAMALCMLSLLGTSLLISKELFAALALEGAFAVRAAHMVLAFWALVLLGLHLGTRWSLVIATARQVFGPAQPSLLRAWGLRGIAAAIAVKGAFSAVEIGLGPRLRFQYALDMWDFKADTLGFFVNHLSILGLLAVLGHYGLRVLRVRR